MSKDLISVIKLLINEISLLREDLRPELKKTAILYEHEIVKRKLEDDLDEIISSQEGESAHG